MAALGERTGRGRAAGVLPAKSRMQSPVRAGPAISHAACYEVAMLRHLLPLALVAALSGGSTCTPQRASEPPPGEAHAAAAEKPSPAEEARCVDDWLAKNNRDEYGSPKGTMYMGGTPLFDEATGQQVDRLEYIYRNNPEVKALCRPGK